MRPSGVSFDGSPLLYFHCVPLFQSACLAFRATQSLKVSGSLGLTRLSVDRGVLCACLVHRLTHGRIGATELPSEVAINTTTDKYISLVGSAAEHLLGRCAEGGET